ncbi:carboxypeptidase-like regulatory domain-containing protein [Spirosoma agri]|uniref:Carboxypeptidase regulatory-like domain-containing protein n=1 Tax=Spirosoma agri TaxID=1987381 RepID=A0A6M0ICI8_9BACT|nr:carboxypeptidase-like regulatory domain-containing protein [Spirosoma agri]NEU65909.1 carboxypeptidase regulatory-like domain-containing protein [Spirosoma agri]
MAVKHTVICLSILLPGSCEGENRETTIFGKVIDDQGQPVSQLPVSVSGHKKWTLSSYRTLATAYTDSSGNYSTRFVPPKEYNQLTVLLDFGLGSPKPQTRKDYQSQPFDLCCLSTSSTQEYSFTLIAR